MASTFLFLSFFLQYMEVVGKCTLTFISSMHSMHSNFFILFYFITFLLFIFPIIRIYFFYIYTKHIECAHMNYVYISDDSADSYLRLQ